MKHHGLTHYKRYEYSRLHPRTIVSVALAEEEPVFPLLQRHPLKSEQRRRRVLVAVDPKLRLCSPRGGVRRTTYLSDTIWIERTSAGASDEGGEVTVLRRSEAEALALVRSIQIVSLR